MKKTKIDHYTDKEALDFHKDKKPGKIEISSSKNMTTKRDLALAYSPGVAAPVRAINDNPEAAFDYTSKGNLVAVISNGSAILGMGNLGALASKPVMEGKAVLFKRFADIDSIDLEIDSENPDEIINSIKNFAPSFGGINLEDIAAPDCFIIEEKLKEILDIPVFHDDQHGTAIITTAALINALDISKKKIDRVKIVVNGAGASAMACANLFKKTGVPQKNITMVDRTGVIYRGRDNLNQWKSSHAIETKDRTLDDAITNADVFLGLSAKGALTKDMVKKMAKNPIIFACANPDPEIIPEEIEEVRDDAIIATGRSDYPNQVNNLIGFPYIFRGALDVRSKTINEEMKIAAANAIAKLAKEDVPDEVIAAMGGERPHYGKDYIIPSTFDPRLISVIPAAVAKAAIDTGVARKKIDNFEIYKDQLKQRLDPTVTIMQGVNSYIKKKQKKVAFDPRSVGTQIDDSIMEKSLSAKILLEEKSHFFSVKSKVLDGRIFLTGKVDDPEQKLKLTKIAWETQGVRSVRNDIKVKEEFNFKQSAKDILITSQLRTALIFNKKIKATNYQIDTYKKKIYIYGIALKPEEKQLVIDEAKQILDVRDVIASIILVDDLRIQKD